jgi:cytochrome oxidase Cu insertion factor (SCO1/SenC/PrrC family)/thiol-disulfide isomerase/thioredoxin
MAVILVAGVELTSPRTDSPGTPASNPDLDPGTTLSGAAPGFTLTDQFGRPVSLRSFRGEVVIPAFNDSQCTTSCPLTTTAMVDAKATLGPAAARVQLLGIDANPTATAVADVRAHSQAHGIVHARHFLTGSLPAPKQAWKASKIKVATEQGQIDHTPALFMIDPDGRLCRLWLTQQSHAAVPQLAQLLAEAASRLLPGHQRTRSSLSHAQILGLAPTAKTVVARAGGGTVKLGPGGSQRLYLFFATWDQEVTDLRAHLEAQNAYRAQAAGRRLPALTAVDEASVEPSPQTLPAFLSKLSHPLAYPVAIDRSGRVADGYGVQDEPWLVLTSSSGRILSYYDVSTSGWLSRGALRRQISNALARTPQGRPGAAAARAQLAASPPPLAAVHAQADHLLAGERSLEDRIRSLRGSPVVLNVWGSWCAPRRAEFTLLASASARYDRRVALLGADVNDDAGDARAFLAQHRVSYPSYQTSSAQLTGIGRQGWVGATPSDIRPSGEAAELIALGD